MVTLESSRLFTNQGLTRSGWRQRGVDPGAPRVRLEYGVRHELRVQTIVKARNGRAAFHDRRDELPHQVVAEDRGGCALRGVARAVGGLDIFGRNRDRGEVLARLAQENRIGLVQPVGSRPLRAVDLRPLVAEAVAIIALGQGCSLPDPRRAAGEYADQTRPVINVRRISRRYGTKRLSCRSPCALK